MINLKVEYISGNRAWCCCPWHDDVYRPNLSITLTKDYYGRYKCWACGKIGRLSKKQMVSLNLSEHESYKDCNNYKVRWGSLVNDYVNALNRLPLIKTALINSLGVSDSCFALWNIGYDGQAYTIPMMSSCEEIDGIQRRFPNSKKCCVTGSKLGMFKSEKWIESNNPIYICEGFSDTICVEDLGFQAIGRPHCHYIEGIIDYLYYIDGCIEGYESIIIIPDNDEVGKSGAGKLFDKIDKQIRCRNLQFFTFEEAKDIREYIKIKGKDIVIKELRSYYVPF